MIFQSILSILAPHDCLGCRAEGALLCTSCAYSLSPIPDRCYRCRSLQPSGRTCTACQSSSPLDAVRVATPYRSLAKDMVWQLKFSGAQAAAVEMARKMAPLLAIDPNTLIVPVPTATTRVRKRGYDQSVLLALAIARQTGARYVPALRRLGQQHQVGASRGQRVAQLQEAYRCSRPTAVIHTHIILIDDVLTTGATLESAAKTLKHAGARRVSGLVFAQA